MPLFDNRPGVQIAVYGAGTFASVFATAMLATGFMITGGFTGHDDGPRMDEPPRLRWSQMAIPDPAPPPDVRSVATRAPEPSFKRATAFERDAQSATLDRVSTPREPDVADEIDRLFIDPPALSAPNDALAASTDDPDEDIAPLDRENEFP